MAKKLKQTYPIKDNGVNGEGGTRQAAARMKEEEEGISMANYSEEEEGRHCTLEWKAARTR